MNHLFFPQQIFYWFFTGTLVLINSQFTHGQPIYNFGELSYYICEGEQYTLNEPDNQLINIFYAARQQITLNPGYSVNPIPASTNKLFNRSRVFYVNPNGAPDLPVEESLIGFPALVNCTPLIIPPANKDNVGGDPPNDDNLDPLIGISIPSPEEELSEEHFAIFPNPTEHTIKLSIYVHTEEVIHANLLSIRGKRLQTLIKGEKFSPGYSERKFDLNEYSAGLYLLKVETQSGLSFTKRISKL